MSVYLTVELPINSVEDAANWEDDEGNRLSTSFRTRGNDIYLLINVIGREGMTEIPLIKKSHDGEITETVLVNLLYQRHKEAIHA